MQETPIQFLGQRDSPGEERGYPLQLGLRCGSNGKESTRHAGDPFLGQEDSLEDSVATHSCILAWRIPVGRGAWRATVHGVPKSQT